MNILTHPSNPPVDAINFTTQQSGSIEVAHWMQNSKPDVKSTQDAAYKVLKCGEVYMVVWARPTASK